MKEYDLNDLEALGEVTAWDRRVITIAVDARGEETHAELREAAKKLLPPSCVCLGGGDRIRVGDPVLLGGGRTHDIDRQARVVFQFVFWNRKW